MIVGLSSAFLASLFYGVASVAQSVGARRAPAVATVGVRGLTSIARQPVYLLGVALDGLGFLISLAALHTLPLFVAEAVLASSVGVTAVVAAVWLHVQLRRDEMVTLSLLLVGLILLAVSARPERPAGLSTIAAFALLGCSVAVAGALALTATRTSGGNAAGFAALAGLGFAGVGITVRVMQVPPQWWQLLARPGLYAVAVFGIAGMAGFATALQRGAVTVVTAVVFAVETVIPALIGVMLLGDRPRAGFTAVAVLGFLTAVVAAIVLARRSTPNELTPGAAPRHTG